MLKIKITWDNVNVINTTVRVYKKSTAFTHTSLPGVLVELPSNIHEYDDADVIEGDTWFYMVSCYDGSSERFSACYEQKIIDVYSTKYLKITGFSATQYAVTSNSTINYQAMSFNFNGSKMYTQDVATSSIRIYNLSTAFTPTSATFVKSVAIGSFAYPIHCLAFFKKGMRVALTLQTSTSTYRLVICDLLSPFEIDGLTIVATLDLSSYIGRIYPSDDGRFAFVVNAANVTRYNLDVTGSVAVLSNASTSYKIANTFVNGFAISTNGRSAIVIQSYNGYGAYVDSIKLNTPFDFGGTTEKVTVTNANTDWQRQGRNQWHLTTKNGVLWLGCMGNSAPYYLNKHTLTQVEW